MRAIMRPVRPAVGKLLAATLLVLCVGLQVLEATGHWDQALKDTNDEAVIVVVVLCVGAAIAMAHALRRSLRPTRTVADMVLAATATLSWPSLRFDLFSSRGSPPVSLRI
jgi:hypothetical protein